MSRRPLRLPALVAVAVAVSWLASGSASSATVVHRAVAHTKVAQSTTVKPDFAYYRGKTVTLYAGGAPGGTFYSEVSIIAAPMAAYLHCTINIVDVSQGSTVPEQNDVAGSPPNGLTFGEAGIGTDISQQATNTALINFALSQVVPIGAIYPSDNTLIVQPSSGIKNLTQLLNAGPINVLGQVSGIALLETNVLFHAYQSKAVIVTGFGNATTEFAGFLAGDGVAEWASLAQGISAVQEGKAVVVAQLFSPPKGITEYGYFRKVPTLAEYYAKHKPTTPAEKAAMEAMIAMSANDTNQLLFAPKGTPAKYAAALTAAFRSVMLQKTIVPAMLNAGLTPGYISPAVALAALKIEIKREPIVRRFLG